MNAQPDTVLDIFRRTGAYLRGHFKLTSGLHSPEYLQCALVLQHPRHAERLGAELGVALRELAAPEEVAMVVSPAMGGLIIGHEVARALGVPHIFTERDADGKMTLRRGFTLPEAAPVAVVEDVVTTGGSTREVVELIRAGGARPVAAGSVIDRSGGRADVGVPRVALATLEVVSYPPDDCPLCREGPPAIKPGSRK